MTKTAIAYYRVSTKRQGESGLGLEGQQAAVAEYLQRAGIALVASYTEVESGKRSDRAELNRATSHAKRIGASLVVAKLDRLARNVAFTSKLMASGVEFTACDNPHANRLTIHILAAVAEDEAQRISDRTKAALAAAKARGVKLGSARKGHWSGLEDKRLEGLTKARGVASQALHQAANAAYTDLIEPMQAWRAEGKSLREIAAALNDQGHTTRRGKPWNPMQVRSVLIRFEK